MRVVLLILALTTVYLEFYWFRNLLTVPLAKLRPKVLLNTSYDHVEAKEENQSEKLNSSRKIFKNIPMSENESLGNSDGEVTTRALKSPAEVLHELLQKLQKVPVYQFDQDEDNGNHSSIVSVDGKKGFLLILTMFLCS